MEPKTETNCADYIESILQTLRRNVCTLLDCPERFHGEYSPEKIDRFINYIEAYKSAKNVNDKQALMELPHLLLTNASIWWHIKKNEIMTWEVAMQKLRKQFSKVRPAHELYMEIFEKPPDERESLEKFVYTKLELFSQLPHPQPTEKMQLDMIYSLLPTFIRNNIERSNIMNFRELIQKVKGLTEVAVIEEQRKCSEVNNENELVTDLKEIIIPNTILNEQPVKRNTVLIEPVKRKERRYSKTAEDHEPLIKVRRTEDLMPIKKETQCMGNISFNTDHREFVAEIPDQTKNTKNKVRLLGNPEDNFIIDSELMDQINSIIEGNDRVSVSAPPLQSSNHKLIDNELIEEDQQSDIVGQSECQPSSYLHPAEPGENTIINSMDTHSSVGEQTKKKRLRCCYCRTVGHTMSECVKIKRKLVEKEKQPNFMLTAVESPVIAAPVSAITTSVVMMHTERETQTLQCQKHLPPNSSADEGYQLMTTKLILPADVPNSAKLIMSKSRNSNTPSPKCHQCGAVGYYRSICPNCSPIYFYKPHFSTNR